MSDRPTYPAPPGSSPTIPVQRPTVAQQLARVAAGIAESKAIATAEAHQLRRVLKETGVDCAMSTIQRAEVLHLLDHAAKYGQAYGVEGALKIVYASQGLPWPKPEGV